MGKFAEINPPSKAACRGMPVSAHCRCAVHAGALKAEEKQDIQQEAAPGKDAWPSMPKRCSAAMHLSSCQGHLLLQRMPLLLLHAQVQLQQRCRTQCNFQCRQLRLLQRRMIMIPMSDPPSNAVI